MARGGVARAEVVARGWWRAGARGVGARVVWVRAVVWRGCVVGARGGVSGARV